MGVLDEAIRQHLELKRRRGASQDELQRQEQEALGPVRRETPTGGHETEPSGAGVAGAAEAERTRVFNLEHDASAGGQESPAGAEQAAPEAERAAAGEEPAPAAEEATPAPESGAPRAEAPAFSPEETRADEARRTGKDEQVLEADVVEEEVLSERELDDDEILDDTEMLDDDLVVETGPPTEPAQSGTGASQGPPDEGETPYVGPVEEDPLGDEGAGARDRASYDEDTVYHAPPVAEPGTHGYDEELEDQGWEDEELEFGDAAFEPLDDEEEGYQDGPAGATGEAVTTREEEPAPAPVDDPDNRDDVLEETPEFLEETPEHERLWFEQKPPGDFDLDR